MRCFYISLISCVLILIGTRSYYLYREKRILKKAYHALEQVRQARLAEQEKYKILEHKQETQAAKEERLEKK